MDSIILTITEVGGTVTKKLKQCISLNYIKEYYTPYSTMKGSFVLDEDIGEIIDAELSVNGTIVHKGIIDTVEIKELSSKKILTINSRSHTSMLGQNELTPGTISGVSLNSLIGTYIPMPYVYHEDLSSTVNYLYIKEHSSIWENIVNLCLKQYNKYPYIANINTVRFNIPSDMKSIILSKDNGNIVFAGNCLDYTKMVSNYHMKDTEGTYCSYNKSESNVAARNIVRHKHIAFDNQWLDDPSKGLGYRLNYGMRGYKASFVSYLGYLGEDINDFVSYGKVTNKRISKIQINGDEKGVITKLTAYFDKYNNT